MKCYACKTDIRDEDSFCKKCGSPQRFTKLINQALQKDQEALAWLYKMTYNNVYHTICAVAKLDDDTVFDLIQDIYIKAFQNLSQLKEPEAFRGWIKVISRNETINYLRKKKEVTFSQMASVDSDEMIEFEDTRKDRCPEEIVDQKETARLLNEILDQLSEEQRIVVYMHYYEQLQVKDIANILDVSEGTVKSRLNYGRKKIKVCIKELEKKGTKLYGLAPISFFFALFATQEAQASEIPNPVTLQNIETKLSSRLSNTSYSENPTQNINKNHTTMSGKEAVKTVASITGKSTLNKVVASVVTIAIVGAGGVGIHSMKKEEEPQKKQDEIVTEQESPVQNINLDDLIGGYGNDEYLLELSYIDGSLFIQSGIIPGKEMFSYAYDEVQVDGNTMKATYEECNGGDVVNVDGTITNNDVERTDTFVLDDDGTLTVTFAGINEIRSGSYKRYEGGGSVFDVAIEDAKLEEFLIPYEDQFFYYFNLTYENGVLSIKSSPLPGREDFIINNYQGSNPNPVDTITYEYDSFEIKEDRHGYSLYGYHTNFDGCTEPDIFALNGDGSVTAVFQGTLKPRFATYGPYDLNEYED